MADAIESREQNLIQRIRTSGLAQNREILLVDEALEIRKERRRLVSKLTEEINSSKEMARKWEQQFLALEQRVDKQQRNYHQRENDFQLKSQEQLQQLQQEMQRKIDDERSKLQLSHASQEEKLKSVYEQKLLTVTAKLEELIQEQKNHDLAQAKVIANKLVKKLSSDLEERYNKKIREYKECLLQVAEREKALEESLTKNDSELSSALAREKNLVDTLHGLQSRLEVGFLREKESEKRQLLLMTENEALKEAKKSLEKEILELRSVHEIALRNVDEKVRKMLESKEREISALRTQITNLTRQNAALEGVFSDLNSDLSNIRPPSKY